MQDRKVGREERGIRTSMKDITHRGRSQLPHHFILHVTYVYVLVRVSFSFLSFFFLTFSFFLLDIFFIYISNAILKVPYTLPPSCSPTHPLPLLGLGVPLYWGI
jgi:hypothetical protein